MKQNLLSALGCRVAVSSGPVTPRRLAITSIGPVESDVMAGDGRFEGSAETLAEVRVSDGR